MLPSLDVSGHSYSITRKTDVNKTDLEEVKKKEKLGLQLIKSMKITGGDDLVTEKFKQSSLVGSFLCT